jgi:histidyl-tRNA synthetase
MAQKPSIPKGTRDFSPMEMARRNYIFDVIRKAFHLYGYAQIETPAMENLSTLMGKYGEEGDKLLFKILNSGNFMQGVDPSSILAKDICEKGLRYDLTVPFARFVVQHRQDLQMPFKRFQIQPVWRADRPQKGRYREFYQCDADVVGSTSLLNEVELLSLIDYVFTQLKIRTLIKLNNRKILAGIAEMAGEADKLTDITVAIDKIDKIGKDNVIAELQERGISAAGIEKLTPLLDFTGTNSDKLVLIKDMLSGSEIGMKGIEELEFVMQKFNTLNHKCELEFDMSLARGLNYYTGTIIEVKALDVEIGSITGGGRYDNLTGVFGMSGLSGVGISFGADRIYDVLNQLNLYPEEISSAPKVLFLNLGDKEADESLKCIDKLRQSGIAAMLYPDAVKMKKQMVYADTLKAPYVAIIGENELNEGKITLKNMQSGTQQNLTIDEIISQWNVVS